MRKKAIRILSVAIGVMAVMIVAMGGYAYKVYSDAWHNPGNVLTAEPGPQQTMVVVQTDPTTGNTTEDVLHFNEDVVSVVLIGVDHSVNREGSQADVIIVCAVNTKMNEVQMITIPRDTYTTVKKINSKGEVTGTTQFKINSSYNYGGQSRGYGYENVLDSISNLFGGIKMPYYIGVNMDSIGPITKKIGGVPIVIDADFSKWGMPKGSEQVLMGDKALTYIRERKLPGSDGSDMGRTERQRKFLIALAKVLQKKGAVEMATTLYNEAAKYIDTNMTLEEIVAFASILRDMDLDNLKFQTIEGKYQYVGKYDCYLVDEEALEELVQDVYYEYGPVAQ